MPSLDDKIGFILQKVRGWKHEDGIRAMPINDVIALIKQAFADEWGDPGSILSINGVQRVFGKPEYMTGPEWLYRFQAELTDWMMTAPDNSISTILQAAKRAAGTAPNK